MKLRTIILLACSHAVIAVLGFMVGMYTLPILTAPPSPSDAEINALILPSNYTAEFTKELKGSDAFHWGEGKVSIAENHISLLGKLSPGPDYKLYLSPVFVETEADFKRLKPSMKYVGDIKTFENFIVNSSTSIALLKYNTVVVWCESFDEFITAAQYR